MGDYIVQVLTSWQIWVVTIVLVIYISVVRYVTRVNRYGSPLAPPPKAKKVKAEAKAKPAPANAPQTDELGLEEGGDDVPIQEE